MLPFNPTSNHVNAQVRFLISSGGLAPVSFHQAQSRLSIRADDYTDTCDLATLVTSDNPIATKRVLVREVIPPMGIPHFLQRVSPSFLRPGLPQKELLWGL